MLIWSLSSEWVALFWIQHAGQFILDPSWCLPRLSQQLLTRSASAQSSDKESALPLTCICHSRGKKKESMKKNLTHSVLSFSFSACPSICLAAQHRHDEWESKGSAGGGGARAHHRLLLHGWLQHHQHGRPGHWWEGRGLFQAEGQVHEWAEQNPLWVCLTLPSDSLGMKTCDRHFPHF